MTTRRRLGGDLRGGVLGDTMERMTEELIGVERRGDVCLLTLRRPEKLNALSTALERELGEALVSAELTTSRAVVIAGEGRAFSAGADVTEFRDATPASILAYYRDTGDVYERFAALPQPTIAAIHGWCVGGGLELALAADFRIADEAAAFSLPEVQIGIIPSSGGTHRLVRLLGTAHAKELVLLRDRVDAPEALRLGLVTEVVAVGAALDRALELAAVLAGLPQLAVALAKQAIDAMAESSREAGVLIERIAYAALAQTPDAQCAVEAFVSGQGSSGGGGSA
jgi:enoyl-CoA hydratase/carnithine racemase